MSLRGAKRRSNLVVIDEIATLPTVARNDKTGYDTATIAPRCDCEALLRYSSYNSEALLRYSFMMLSFFSQKLFHPPSKNRV